MGMKITDSLKKAKSIAEDIGSKAETTFKEIQKQAAPVVDKTAGTIKEQFEKTRGTVEDVKKNINDKINYSRNIVTLGNSEIRLLIPDGYSGFSLKSVAKNRPSDRTDAKGYQKITEASQNTVIISHIPEEKALYFGGTDEIIIDARSKLAVNQGIIKIEAGTSRRGYGYQYRLIKTRKSDLNGVYYRLCMNIKTEAELIEVKADFTERGMAGYRDSVVLAMLRNVGKVTIEDQKINNWSKDPYDDNVTEGFLMNASERECFDEMFPDSPLAQAREFIRAITEDELIIENPDAEAEETTDKESEAALDSEKSAGDSREQLDSVQLASNRNFKVVDVDGIGVSEKENLDDLLREAIDEYNAEYAVLNDRGTNLYVERNRSVDLILFVENLVNSIANHPKEFDKEIAEIETCRKEFAGACDFARRELEAAQKSAVSAGAGIAGGMAVVALAPSAAMWIATTFGTASTGTAISALSGAAATNAALAWLGGGAAAAGGGGMAAGNALLALAGPVGWSIAGATLLTTVILFANKKMKLEKQKKEEIEQVLKNSETLKEDNAKIKVILEKTISLREALNDHYCKSVCNYGKDFLGFSKEDQLQLGTIVNVTKSLAILLRESL